jgi:hypothetical protein
MARRPRSPLLLIGLVLAGCASSPGGSSSAAPVQPVLSVEQFLRAANTRDFVQMARIFGTGEGPIVDQTGGGFSCAFRRMGSWIGLGERCVPWEEIEYRMSLIAEILKHDDYQVRSETSVPGRSRQTIQIGVDILQAGTRYPEVPFLVVRSAEGRWLVENVDLTRITAL